MSIIFVNIFIAYWKIIIDVVAPLKVGLQGSRKLSLPKGGFQRERVKKVKLPRMLNKLSTAKQNKTVSTALKANFTPVT